MVFGTTQRSRTVVKLAGVAALLLASGAQAALLLLPTLRLSAEERYDDDRLLTVEEGGGAGQLMTKVSPEAGLTLRDPTLELQALYAVDLMLRHGSGNQSLDHRGRLSLDKALSRRMQLRGSLGLWRVEDPTSLPRLGMGRTLSPMFYADAEVGGRYRLTRRWNLDLNYGFEAARILEAAPGGEGDNGFGFVHEPSAGAWYAATSRTLVGTTYRFQAFQFGGNLAQAHGAFAGLRHRLTRQLTFAAHAGPVFFTDPSRRASSGFLPRVALELNRDGRSFDWTLVMGHDLVGANGFDTALWADYASAIGTWAITHEVNLFSVASWFRNGRAPNQGVLEFDTTDSSNGYALGAGVEWKFNKQLRLQGSLDRIAQVRVGGEDGGLARNIASLRLVFTALAPNERRPGH